MEPTKRQNLENAGWTVGTAEEFLELCPIICPVCGVYKVDGTFRFSYQPTKPVSANDVAGLVCANLGKNPKGESLKPHCINKTGDPTEGDSWEKRLKSIGE